MTTRPLNSNLALSLSPRSTFVAWVCLLYCQLAIDMLLASTTGVISMRLAIMLSVSDNRDTVPVTRGGCEVLCPILGIFQE